MCGVTDAKAGKTFKMLYIVRCPSGTWRMRRPLDANRSLGVISMYSCTQEAGIDLLLLARHTNGVNKTDAALLSGSLYVGGVDRP